MEDKERREGLTKYLEKMQKLLKFREEKMFENNVENLAGFGVMNNDAIPTNSKMTFNNKVKEKAEFNDDPIF